VCVGLIEISMELQGENWPEEVKDNFREKVEQTLEAIRMVQAEFVQFGEALDHDDPR